MKQRPIPKKRTRLKLVVTPVYHLVGKDAVLQETSESLSKSGAGAGGR